MQFIETRKKSQYFRLPPMNGREMESSTTAEGDHAHNQVRMVCVADVLDHGYRWS